MCKRYNKDTRTTSNVIAARVSLANLEHIQCIIQHIYLMRFYSLISSPKKLHHSFQVQNMPLLTKTLLSSLLSGQIHFQVSILVLLDVFSFNFEQIQWINKVFLVFTLHFSIFRMLIRQSHIQLHSIHLMNQCVSTLNLYCAVTFQHNEGITSSLKRASIELMVRDCLLSTELKVWTSLISLMLWELYRYGFLLISGGMEVI